MISELKRLEVVLMDEGGVNSFIGIQIVTDKDINILIETRIQTLRLEGGSNQHKILTGRSHLHRNIVSEKFNESWKYRSLIYMLTLAINNHTDVKYTLNQCVRLHSDPKKLHTHIFKRIGRYILDITKECIRIKLNDDLRIF